MQPRVKNKAKAHYRYSLSMWNQTHCRICCLGGREGDCGLFQTNIGHHCEIRTLSPFDEKCAMRILKITSVRAAVTVLCHFSHGMINKWKSWFSKSFLCTVKAKYHTWGRWNVMKGHAGGTDALVLYWCLCVYLSCISCSFCHLCWISLYFWNTLTLWIADQVWELRCDGREAY